MENTKPFGNTELHKCAWRGDIPAARTFLLTDGWKVDARKVDVRDDAGNTPLHIAALKGRLDFMKLLLEVGADVDAEGEDKHTALHTAAWKGNHGMACLLLYYRASGSKKNKDGNTAQQTAILWDNPKTAQTIWELSNR